MVWVRAEYAGALAVISTWIATLVPWNITYSTGVSGGSILFLRFPFFQIRYAYGVPTTSGVRISDPFSATAFQAGQTIQAAYQVWAIGAVVLALAVAFSLFYYRSEERVEDGPMDPVRLLGGLLTLTGLLFAASTYLLVTRGFPGLPLPVGVILLFVFGGLLLTVDRT